ncbi:MAG: hypothetical protein AAFV46_12735 [Cyanobacteria bacterium J06635_11]
MKQDLNLPGEIVVCPIVREPDGQTTISPGKFRSCFIRRRMATC